MVQLEIISAVQQLGSLSFLVAYKSRPAFILACASGPLADK